MSAPILVFATALMISTTVSAVECTRNVKWTSGSEFTVELKLNKGDIAGIARLAESIPNGFEVTYIKSESGTFSFKDQKVKFIWMALPTEKEVLVSYKVKSKNWTPGNYSIDGKFSYVEEGLSKDYIIEKTDFSIKKDKSMVLAGVETDPISAVETPTISSPASSVSKRSKALLSYTIQLAATSSKLPADHFSKNYNITAKVTEEKVNNVYKYSINNVPSINDAIDWQSKLENKGVEDAFITAWWNNERITIKEAKVIEAGDNK